MRFRRLGESGLVVSVVGLGTNNLGMRLDEQRSRGVVAAALDETDWSELVGTIAGDDTILIVCPDKEQARALAERIEEMLS